MSASITDRDLGDESRIVPQDWPYLAGIAFEQSHALDVAIARMNELSADIATLESALREKDDMLAATYAELHEARRQIDMYRAALKELQAKAAMTVPEGSFY